MDLQLPSFPVLLSLLFSLLMAVTILMKRARNSKLPPGPWRLPLVGNLHQLLLGYSSSSSSYEVFSDLAKKHGPFMYLEIGQVPTVIVSSPEYAKEIMRTHDVVFASRPRTLAAQIIGYDCTDIAFAPYGDYWRQLRKICMQALFSPKRVQSLEPIREKEVFNTLQHIIANSNKLNFTQMVTNLSYSIVSRAAFGEKSSDHDEFISIVEEDIKVAGGFEFGELFPSLRFLDWTSRPKYESLKQRSSRILEKIIKQHMINQNNEKSEEEQDLVDVLLKYHNKANLGLTLDNIKGVIWDIFEAGSETTAVTEDWAMVELMRNPIMMKKAQDEVREVFGRKGLVDKTSIHEMKYLKLIIKETLRLHPPAPFLLPRENSEKCEINGYEIPNGTRVLVNVWGIGRHAKYWNEPESFIPERFDDSSIDFKGNNFEYIPFGAGRRICPGITFGVVSLEYSLALMLYHFDWKLPNGMKPQDLDMSELFGIAVRRKDDLYLIPTIYHQSPLAN
uniref:Cytochrome P450 n=1 Tax=Cannabis sativa TaxID=3483 RepID=A0A803PPV0_CANSA